MAITWITLTALPEGYEAASWDINCWRYCVPATAGKIITHTRRILLLPADAAETTLITAIATTYTELRSILAPTTRPLHLT